MINVKNEHKILKLGPPNGVPGLGVFRPVIIMSWKTETTARGAEKAYSPGFQFCA